MNLKMYNINRRKFLGYFGCSCCSLLLPSCSTVPITERRQLSIIPESRINQQAAAAYEKFRSKTKLITKGSQLNEIRKNLYDVNGNSITYIELENQHPHVIYHLFSSNLARW